MKWFEIAPLLSVAINLVSVASYAKERHWPMVMYWLCAAGLTSIVTFWLPRWKL